MINDKRNFIFKIIVSVIIGTLIGLLYEKALAGFVTSILIILIIQIRSILIFDRVIDKENSEIKVFLSGYWEVLQSKIQEIIKQNIRASEELKIRKKEYDKSVEAMPDSAILLDENLNILLFNKNSISMMGLDIERDINQKIVNIIRDPLFSEYVMKGDYDNFVDILSPVNKNNLRCRIVPYGVKQKLLMIRDVSESFRINKIRRDFIANASHELRTPLTVVKGYLDTMSSDQLTDEWSNPIKEMKRQTNRMSEIVTTLLDLSQLEGKPLNDHQKVDINHLLQSTKKLFTESMKTPEISIECDKDIYLMGSPFELESLLTNLLSNAVRHTSDDGEIKIICTRIESGCRLSVEDTGEGVIESDIPRLTERFFRVNRGRSRKNGGIGLGLAIVKRVLIRHEGELSIESKIGVGSKFICLFPSSRLLKKEK